MSSTDGSLYEVLTRLSEDSHASENERELARRAIRSRFGDISHLSDDSSSLNDLRVADRFVFSSGSSRLQDAKLFSFARLVSSVIPVFIVIESDESLTIRGDYRYVDVAFNMWSLAERASEYFSDEDRAYAAFRGVLQELVRSQRGELVPHELIDRVRDVLESDAEPMRGTPMKVGRRAVNSARSVIDDATRRSFYK